MTAGVSVSGRRLTRETQQTGVALLVFARVLVALVSWLHIAYSVIAFTGVDVDIILAAAEGDEEDYRTDTPEFSHAQMIDGFYGKSAGNLEPDSTRRSVLRTLRARSAGNPARSGMRVSSVRTTQTYAPDHNATF